MDGTNINSMNINGSGARIVNLVVSAWLFISAFVWPHTMAQRTNTWILGLIGFVISLVALSADSRARYLNTILAIWLFISAFALPSTSGGTVVNNVIVAIVIFIFSLMGRQPVGPRVGRPRHA